MRMEPVSCRAPRGWTALVLLVTWSLGGIWNVSHAFEHTDSEHHATFHEEHQATSELSAIGGGHGHAHPAEDFAVSTTTPRFEPRAALTSAARTQSAHSPTWSPRVDWEVSDRASPGACGPSRPRAPPLS